MTKTGRHKGLALGSFLVPEIDMIFGDGVGASLVVSQVEPGVRVVSLVLSSPAGDSKNELFYTCA